MKKLISILLIAVVLLSFSSVSGWAEGNPNLVISDATASPGGEVEVLLSIQNNPGIRGISTEIMYDSSILELIEAVPQMPDGLGTWSLDTVLSDHIVYWYNIEKVAYSGENIILLKFKVAESAAEGTTEIGLRFGDWDGIYDVTDAPIDDYDITPGKVTIGSAGPEFEGHAILLTGQVGLQFFLKLPEGKTPADYPDSYVTFEGNKVDSATQYPLPAETAVINGEDSGKYLFTLSLTSIQMADKFTPTFHYTEDEEEKTVTGEAFSAQDYIDWALTALSGKNLAIVQALADYGYYAQPYLSAQNGWTIGTDYAEMTTHIAESFNYSEVMSAAQEYAFVKSTSDSITKISYKLSFNDTLVLTVYLTPADGVTLSRVTVDGAEQTPTKSGNRYMVVFSGIKATELTRTHTISAEGATATVSPMSYVYSMLTSATTSTEGKNLVCALFNYAQACR